MAKDNNFSQQLKKLRDSLRATIDERSRRFCSKLSLDVAETFVDRAGRRLTKYATPKDGESMSKIQSISDSMVASQQGIGSVATIPIDSEGLILFLEYGTGYTGYAFGGNPDANAWTYAIHADKYRYHNGRLGFFFTKKNGNYLDESDEYPVTANTVGNVIQSVRGYIRNGKPVRGYIRRVKKAKTIVKQNSVFSVGLRPIRFLYDTKQEIRNFFATYRSEGMSASDLLDKLDELRNAEV